MAGIHIHPHDIFDEGCENILKIIKKIPDLTHIFPQVNTIFERNPNPIGILPRNPKRQVVFGDGKLYVSGFEQKGNIKLSVGNEILHSQDPFQELKNQFDREQYKVVPWINLLNGDFEAEDKIVTYTGKAIVDWICPNSTSIVDFWVNLIIFLNDKYGYKEFMIDRIRYPDWSGTEINPEMIFSCFCSNCTQLMTDKGIDVRILIEKMNIICEMLGKGYYQHTVDFWKEDSVIQQWVQFKQDSVFHLLDRLVTRLPEFTFWIDLWPPSYSWLLGQNYSSLTRKVGTLKHFPYHKLGGGANVQGLIEYFSGENEVRQNECFKAFLKLFNLPYNISYATFKEKGYPIQFVYDENQKVRQHSQDGTRIYSGIQMWNIEVADFLEALEVARKSEADDIIYYCYGWAEDVYFEVLNNF